MVKYETVSNYFDIMLDIFLISENNTVIENIIQIVTFAMLDLFLCSIEEFSKAW